MKTFFILLLIKPILCRGQLDQLAWKPQFSNSFFDDNNSKGLFSRKEYDLTVTYGIIDDYTGEQFSWIRTTTWGDGSAMNDSKVDGVIYRKKGTDYWKRSFSGAANIKWFGATGDGITDDRALIQKAITICAQLKVPLKITAGTYLLNSYGTAAADAAHGNILQIRSNMNLVFDQGSEFLTGPFFNDKAFVLFSGYNAVDTAELKDISNISITKGRFDFSGKISQMRTGYKRRIAFDGAKCSNVLISYNYFYNGDLSNCLSLGFSTYGKRIDISNNVFEDLALSQPSVNRDHSTIYCLADFAHITNNTFIGGASMALVGCCAEIHSSNVMFINNVFSSYTRALFIATNSHEKGSITNILVSNNTGTVTNSFTYLWPALGQSINNLSTTSNNVTHAHVEGYSQLYNGVQGVCVGYDKGGELSNISIDANVSTIIKNISANPFTHSAILFSGRIANASVSNNRFTGHSNGIVIQKNESKVNPTVDQLNVIGNSFDRINQLLKIDADTVSKLKVTRNESFLKTPSLKNLISINTTGTQSGCFLKDNSYQNYLPLVEFEPSPNFKINRTNYASYHLGNLKLAIPFMAAFNTGIAFVNLPAQHARKGNSYKITTSEMPSQLVFQNIGISDIDAVKLSMRNSDSAAVASRTVSCSIEVEMNLN